MSLIVVIKDKDKFYVGCDTRITQGSHFADTKYQLMKKAFFYDKDKGMIVGATGNVGAGDLAASVLRITKPQKLTREYIVDIFWPMFIVRSKESGMFFSSECGTECELLLIMKDIGFYIDPFGGIMEIIDICTLGSGAPIADAVLETLYRVCNYAPRTMITLAIEAAASVKNDISKEVYIGSSDGKEFARYRVPL